MRAFFILLLLVMGIHANAGDLIEVKLNKLSFDSGDTIQLSCRIRDYATSRLAAATLHVWIQDINSKRTWKFRYPVVNGESDASLVITDSIPAGKYAMNFILQRGLFRIDGMIKNNTGPSSINYFMRLKNGQKLFNTIPVASEGNFSLKNVLFENEAVIAFTPFRKVKRNELDVFIATPMDSSFTPVAVFTQLIDVKLERMQSSANPSYQFSFDKTYNNTTLPEVVVTSKQKRKVEDFNERFSLGLFQGENKLFDGLENDEIATTLDIETFLQKHIPGIQVIRLDTGGSRLVWRNEPVVVFIDEIAIDPEELMFVSPSDVAMIKVYNPPATLSMFGRTAKDPSSKVYSGAVAIYTKRANFGLHDNKGRHSFHVKGYTPLQHVWQ